MIRYEELTDTQIDQLLPQAFKTIENIAVVASLDDLTAMRAKLTELIDQLREGDNEQE